ncbi:Tetratricopeptide repeat-containing protein [Catalinimonas alkaloidigena]|uniref:Tetratricopeptide repeat-containing protein n=1 Tax=Catalinimonas alkaloidigena TaxID=1075417 RepID=A0A1G9EWB9_9BACT|nr:tetratricopeptide repeat protein [Catalinimonas alkaloidigena]SDK80411.1 Tetratricopeptide repeat-containing protein [Catalinimonas alkaloidigena]
MRKLALALLFLFSCSSLVMAQDWGDNPDQARLEYVQLKDLTAAKDYAAAKPHFLWLWQHAPKLGKLIYIKGNQIYEGLADAATDATKKAALQDTALMLYDVRVQYGDAEADMMNRKGLKAYTYLKDRSDKQQELYQLYKKIFDLNKNDVYVQNAIPFMQLTCNEKNAGRLTDEDVLANYDQISAAYEAGASGQYKDSWEQVKEITDGLLAGCVNIDCEFVKNNFGPKLKENPSDAVLAKKIASLMYTGKCTDDPLFLEAAIILNKAEPTFGWSKTIGRILRSNKEYDKAMEYYNQAAELADDNTKKGDVLLEVAQLQSDLGQRQSARSTALKAASADPSKKAPANELIGDLYFNSYNDCSGGNPVEKRLVFIAAYEKYQAAGASRKMSTAKAQFPSASEIFTQGYEKGQKMNTGCWIGETVTLQTRPSDN